MSIPNMKGLDTHSEEVQELMGAVPSWIQQWGITAIAAILTGVMALCSIIRLPEKYMAELSPQLNVNDTIICTAYVPKEIATKIKPGQQIGYGILRSISPSTIQNGDYLIEVAMPSTELEDVKLSTPITIANQTILQKLISSLRSKSTISM